MKHIIYGTVRLLFGTGCAESDDSHIVSFRFGTIDMQVLCGDGETRGAAVCPRPCPVPMDRYCIVIDGNIV
ncbi:hypothetical protein RUM43_003478 [Polyplax serrata]|uniref:Uncharacterized protein n=1 Tax=Polyplax serrata TaxID=468196 RepID=A0AAN8S379_POLSC